MNEFCINTSLQEFKETQWRLNISAGELEDIVKQYYRETGSDESFPSDPYILRALIGQNTESYQEAVELWKERFSSSRVFKNQEDAEVYKSMAESYFAPESVLLYKTHEGNFIVRVARPGFENYTAVTPDEIKSASRTERGKMAAKACADFLNHFGISVGDLTSFKEFLKEKDDRDHFNPFELLIKQVNGKSPTSVINGTAKAIAFLMQWSPEMIMFTTAGQYDLIEGLGTKETKKVVDELSFQWQNKKRRNQLVYDLSLEIAKQLKEYYNYPDKFLETEKRGKIAAVWELIKAFFRQFNPIQKARARFLSQFSLDIVKSIINNDPTFVLSDNKIPFKQEDVVSVDLQKLFEESPLEAQLIQKLNKAGYALGGSISLAVRNLLNRTTADLHDIDVEAPYPMTSDEIQMSLSKAGLHPIFFTTHKNKKSTCYSYIISDQPLIMQKNENETSKMDIYDIKGKKVGIIEAYEFTPTDDSFKGYVKCLDVFSYSDTLVYPNETINIGGNNYTFASPFSVVSVKGQWARPKDVFDYTRFIEKFPDFKTVLALNKRKDTVQQPYDNTRESRKKWLIDNIEHFDDVVRRHFRIKEFYGEQDFSGLLLKTDYDPHDSSVREEDIARFYNTIRALGGNPLDFEISRYIVYSPQDYQWKSVNAIDLPYIDDQGNRWTSDFKLKYRKKVQEVNSYYNSLSQDERLSRYALAMQEWEPGDPIPELNKKRDQSQEAETVEIENDSLSILQKKRNTVSLKNDQKIGFLFPDTLYSIQIKEEGNPTLEDFATQEIDGKEYKFSTLRQSVLFRAYNETIKALKELETSPEQKALIKDLNKLLKNLLNEKKITVNFNELNKEIDNLLGESSIESDLSFAIYKVYSPIVEKFRTLIDNRLQGGQIISFTYKTFPAAEKNAYKRYFNSVSESALWKSSIEVSDSPWIEATGEEAERIQKLVNKYHRRQSKDYVRESSLNKNIKGWIEKGEGVALVDVIQAIVEKEKNKYYKLFAQILQPLINEAFADKKVIFVEPGEGEDFEARILKEDLSTIQVNKNSKSALNTFVSTILHETIHLLTITEVDDSLKPAQQELYTEIDQVRKAVITYIQEQFRDKNGKLSWSEEDIYGLTSTADFISEFFTNRNFQKFLDSIKIEDVQKVAPIQNESVYSKVIKAVKEYLEGIFRKITHLYGTSVFEYLIPQMMDTLKESATVIIGEKNEELVNDAYEKTMNLFKNTIFGQTSYIRNSLKQSTQLRAKIQSVKKIPGMSEVDIMRTVKNLAYTVSDLVTFIMTNPDQAQKFKDTYRIDPTKISRQEVINTIGLRKLFSLAQERYLLNGSEETFEKRDALSMRMPVLILLATPHLKYLEGVIPEITLIKDESSTEAESDKEDEADENTTESWQIETRTIPIENSLSKELNLFLSSIREKKKVVKNKQEVIEDSLDEFGMANRERRQKVMNVLLNIVSGSKSMQEMITKLKEARDEGRHLWLDQVIEMLEEDKGKYYIEQAQFFTVFNRHKMQYIKGESNSNFSPINSTTPRRRNYNKVVIGYTRNISQFGKDSNKGEALKALNEFLEYFNKVNQNSFEKNIKIQYNVAAKYGELLNYLGITKIDQSELQASITDWTTYEDFKNALNYMVETYKKGLEQEDYDPFAPSLEGEESDYNIIGYVKQVLFPYTSMQEDLFVTSVSSNGKMYQGFILPTYTTTIMQGLMSSGEEFIDFITEKYANNEWFRDQNTRVTPGETPTDWRNPILHLITSDTTHKKRLDHAQLLEYNQLQYMKTMPVDVFNEAVLKGFFSGRVINNPKKVSKETTAWYPIPIMANKPSGEFIKFTRFIQGLYQQGIAENTVTVLDHIEPLYKKVIAQHLQSIFKQEVIRIHTVKNREKLKNIVGLKNFDKNGSKFMLLPFFNSSKVPDIIKDYIETGEVKEQEDLDNAIQDYIIQSLNEEAQYYIESIDSFRTIDTIPEISKELKSLKNEIKKELEDSKLSNEEKAKYIEQELDSRRSQLLENFYFNNYLINASLQELFIIDPAFNKNTTDLQKRLLQIHSSGQRMYTEATDRYGNKVSDGIHRAIIIKTEKYKSDIYDFIRKSFESAAERFTDKKEKEAYKQWVESILEKYQKIDVTDGQAFTCPSAMKKKLIMAGQWNDQMEDAYQNIMQGNYSVKDLKVIMQPLKPFSYSFAHISTGIKNKPNQEGDGLLETLDVPMQYKDAEYMLFISDALRSKEDRKSPNFIEALFDFMESTYKDENGQYKIKDGHIIPTEDGIDTILFDSANKDEEFGVFDTEAIAKGRGKAEKKEEKLIKELKKVFENYRNGDNGEEIVKETSYSDYMIQTRLPAHFADQSMRYPTQFRQMIPASIPSFYYDANGERKETKIPVGDRLLTVQEFSDAWDYCFADLAQDGIDDVIEEFGLSYGKNSIERNTRLSAFLINQLLSSDSFSLEALEALTLDENGDFYMPIDDTSSQSSAQKLILSAVRNRINRQKVPGGALVQVANYRGSQDLHIIINEETEGIDHYQVIAPSSMKKVFKDFALPNGDIDFELVKRVAPELLQVVVTRIPTEGPFSAGYGEIVGFAPPYAGEIMMLPKEVTLITGDDNDSDKQYTMTKKVNVSKLPYDSIVNSIFQKFIKSLQKEDLSNPKYTNYKEAILLEIEAFVDGREELVKNEDLKEFLKTIDKKDWYIKTEYGENTKYGKTNKLFDMAKAVLQHPSMTSQILSPQGFDNITRIANEIEGKTNPFDYDPSLANFATHLRFYNLNQSGGSLLSIFASDRTVFSTLSRKKIKINLGKGVSFTLGNRTYSEGVDVAPMFNQNLQFSGNVIGNHVGAAADVTKEDALGRMGFYGKNINTYTSLLKIGVSEEVAAKFINQPILKELWPLLNSSRNVRTKTILASIKEKLQNSLDELAEEETLTKKDISDQYSKNHKNSLSLGKLEKYLNTPSPYENIDSILHSLEVIRVYELIAAKITPTLTALGKYTKLNSSQRNHLVGPDYAATIAKFKTKYPEEVPNTTILINGVDRPVTKDRMIGDNGQYPMFAKMLKAYNACFEIFDNTSLGRQFDVIADYLRVIIADDKYLEEAITKMIPIYQTMLLCEGNRPVINGKEATKFLMEFPTSLYELLNSEDNKAKKLNKNAFINSLDFVLNDSTGNIEITFNYFDYDRDERELFTAALNDLINDDTTKEIAINLIKYNILKNGIGFSPLGYGTVISNYGKRSLDGYNQAFKNRPSISPYSYIALLLASKKDSYKWLDYEKVKEIDGYDDYVVIDNKSQKTAKVFISSNQEIYRKVFDFDEIPEDLRGMSGLYKKLKSEYTGLGGLFSTQQAVTSEETGEEVWSNESDPLEEYDNNGTEGAYSIEEEERGEIIIGDEDLFRRKDSFADDVPLSNEELRTAIEEALADLSKEYNIDIDMDQFIDDFEELC